jgi:disulfide bond formation protein DsbB
MGTCIACHGPDAKGVVGLGKSLYPADSEFVSQKTDKELVEFILAGRTPDDPLNTTGVGMPAKGGNPAITDQQLYDVVAYIRELK